MVSVYRQDPVSSLHKMGVGREEEVNGLTWDLEVSEGSAPTSSQRTEIPSTSKGVRDRVVSSDENRVALRGRRGRDRLG